MPICLSGALEQHQARPSKQAGAWQRVRDRLSVRVTSSLAEVRGPAAAVDQLKEWPHVRNRSPSERLATAVVKLLNARYS